MNKITLSFDLILYAAFAQVSQQNKHLKAPRTCICKKKKISKKHAHWCKKSMYSDLQKQIQGIRTGMVAD